MKYVTDNKGFTIVELLATMVISSLVVAFVLSMYLFVERLIGNWEKRTELISAVDGCAGQIERDIMTSYTTDECSDSLLVLEMNPIDTVVYRFCKADVSRGGILFGAEAIRLFASVSVSEDTGSGVSQPVRLWSIRVLGESGAFRDSSITRISTAISSYEMVQEEMKRPEPGLN
jgi:prepilin-type N-terminal cleavage/methylation domain-containing protein